MILSDQQLWADFISNDDEAYRMIYESYIQDLYKYGSHFSPDTDLIKDCIQDLFIDLYNYRSKLKKTDNIKAYLFVSLKRNIIKKSQIEEKIKSKNNEAFPFQYALSSDEDEEQAVNEQRIAILEEAINDLSPRQREAIYLKFVAGLDYEELCEILEINYQASRNLIYRGMEKLRETLTKNTVSLWFFLIGKRK